MRPVVITRLFAGYTEAKTTRDLRSTLPAKAPSKNTNKFSA